jgi:hypothetical protein
LDKKKEKNKTTTAATRHQINRPQASRILGQSGTGKNNCRQPAKVVDVDQALL